MDKPCKICRHQGNFNLQTKEFDCINDCVKYEKYEEKKKSRRKYEQGKQVTSLEQILNNNWFYANDKLRHKISLLNMPTGTILDYLNRGLIYFAVLKIN